MLGLRIYIKECAKLDWSYKLEDFLSVKSWLPISLPPDKSSVSAMPNFKSYLIKYQKVYWRRSVYSCTWDHTAKVLLWLSRRLWQHFNMSGGWSLKRTGSEADKLIFRIIVERIADTKISERVLYWTLAASLWFKCATAVKMHTCYTKQIANVKHETSNHLAELWIQSMFSCKWLKTISHYLTKRCVPVCLKMKCECTRLQFWAISPNPSNKR